jgi:hypothetical protein
MDEDLLMLKIIYLSNLINNELDLIITKEAMITITKLSLASITL